MDQGTVLDMATDQDTVLSLAIHRPAGAQVSITDRVSLCLSTYSNSPLHVGSDLISFPLMTGGGFGGGGFGGGGFGSSFGGSRGGGSGSAGGGGTHSSTSYGTTKRR